MLTWMLAWAEPVKRNGKVGGAIAGVMDPRIAEELEGSGGGKMFYSRAGRVIKARHARA
jgi:hypothetical protein